MAERMRAFLRRYRLEAAERDARRGGRRAAARGARPRPSATRRALERLEELGGDAARAFRGRRGERSVELMPSAATHAVLPLVATTAAGASRSTPGCARTGGASAPPAGFWLPECAYAPGHRGAARRARPARTSAPTRAPTRAPRARWRRSRRRAGLVALHARLGGGRSWSGRRGGYPSDPAYAEFHRLSLDGDAPVGDRRRTPTTRPRPRRAAREHARGVRRRGRRAARAPSATERGRPRAGRRSRSTPSCSAMVVRRARLARGGAAARAASAASACVTLPEALERHEPEERAAARVELGRGQGPSHLGLAARSPTSPGRRGGSSCGCCARSGGGGSAPAAARARRARAARGPGERLGVPRPAPPGGRLPVPALDRPRAGAARGHTLRASRRTRACATWPPTSASPPCWSPEPRRP